MADGERARAYAQRVPARTWAGEEAPWAAADTGYGEYMDTKEGLTKVAR